MTSTVHSQSDNEVSRFEIRLQKRNSRGTHTQACVHAAHAQSIFQVPRRRPMQYNRFRYAANAKIDWARRRISLGEKGKGRERGRNIW